jgi:hypothetical protein
MVSLEPSGPEPTIFEKNFPEIDQWPNVGKKVYDSNTFIW